MNDDEFFFNLFGFFGFSFIFYNNIHMVCPFFFLLNKSNIQKKTASSDELHADYINGKQKVIQSKKKKEYQMESKPKKNGRIPRRHLRLMTEI